MEEDRRPIKKRATKEDMIRDDKKNTHTLEKDENFVDRSPENANSKN